MDTKRIAVIVVAVLVLGGAAYGLSRDKDTSTKSTNTDTSQSSSSKQSSSADDSASPNSSDASKNSAESTNTVSISNFTFTPKNITVKKGTMVTWTNNDTVPHDVKETDGKPGPKSDSLAQGESYSYTFNTPGTYKYFCSIHPSMTASVIVTE